MPSNTSSLATGVCSTPTTQTNPIYSHVRHLEASSYLRNVSSSTTDDDQETEAFADPSPISPLEKKQDGNESEIPDNASERIATCQTEEDVQTCNFNPATYSPVIKGHEKWWIVPVSGRNTTQNPWNRRFLEMQRKIRDVSSTANAGQDKNANSLECRIQHKLEPIQALPCTASHIESSYSQIAYHATPILCWEHRDDVRNLREEFKVAPDKKDLQKKDTISWIHPSNQASGTPASSATNFPIDSAEFNEELDGMSWDASTFPTWISPEDGRYSRRKTRNKTHGRNLSFAHSTPIPGVKMQRSAYRQSDSSESKTQRISLDATQEYAKSGRAGPAVRTSPFIKGSKKWWRAPGSPVNEMSTRRPPSWAELETSREHTKTEDMSSTVDVGHASHYTCGHLRELQNEHHDPKAKCVQNFPCEVCSGERFHPFFQSTPKKCRDHVEDFSRKYSASDMHVGPNEKYLQRENGNDSTEHESASNLSKNLQGSYLLSGTLPSALNTGGSSSDPFAEYDEESEKDVEPFSQYTMTSDDHEMYRRYLETKPFVHSPPEYGRIYTPSGEYSYDVSTADNNVYFKKLKDSPLAQSTPVPEECRPVNKVSGLSEDLIYDGNLRTNKGAKPFVYLTSTPKDGGVSTENQVCGLSEGLIYEKSPRKSTKTKKFTHSTPVRNDSKVYTVNEEHSEAITEDEIASESKKGKLFAHSTPVHKSTKSRLYQKLSKDSLETEPISLDTTIGTDSTSWKYYRMKPSAPTSPPPAKQFENKEESSKVNHGIFPRTEGQTDSKYALTDDSDSISGREFSFSKYIATMIEVAGRSEIQKRTKRFEPDDSKAWFDFDDFCKRLYNLIHVPKERSS